MPRICQFFGITIAMFHNDHSPPHFHARYAGQRATIRIDPPGVLTGELSPRVLGLVIDWTSQRKRELLSDWDLARRGLPLNPIAPLE